MPIMSNNQIQELSQKILAEKNELTKLKNALQPKQLDDFTFKNHKGGNTKLSEMFGSHKYLVVIHNMGQSCNYCTMWANGFEGVYKHFDDKAGFVLINHDTIESQKEFADKQGWTFPIYSASNNSFNKDLGFVMGDNSLYPGISTLRKKSDNIIELLSQEPFGPGDNFCSVWHIYDLLPEKFSY